MISLALPGDAIPRENLPTSDNPSVPLKVGPGVRFIPPDRVTPVIVGDWEIDHKKNVVYVENGRGRVSIALLSSKAKLEIQ